ncbi:pentatricopeptide repeat-containing protein At1g74630 [Typha latifolia]|uniref:pentatricopeptide repeat-containing protein At1g74630 n=1 Tax=Typha latifolia TaxID=4733 RepID=UPI003C2E7D13
MSNNLQLQCLSLLQRCKTLTHLKQIHGLISKTRLDSDPIVAGKLLLLAATAISDALGYACRLFSYLPFPDPFMHNTLLRGLAESEQPHSSVLFFTQMRRRDVLPDSFTFAFVLKAAANFRSIHVGRQLHSLVFHHGLETHLFVGTTMVSMYAECGCIDSAYSMFDEMPQRNVVVWNAIVTAAFRVGDLEGARRMFDRMPWRNTTSWNIMLAGYTRAGEMGDARSFFLAMPRTDLVSWNTMIVGFASHGAFGDAFGFFREFLREELGVNEVSLTGILSACAQAGAFESGRILHGHVQKVGLNNVVSVGNALLDMYARCGSIDMAHGVFDWEMEKKSVVSWTSMIAALAMHGYGEAAIELFHEMEANATRPDGITFISVLYACSHSGLVGQGHDLFQRMEETYGIERTIEHYGCMVDLYGRAGLLDKAYEFVTQMPMKPNTIIWRTLLGACSIYGNVRLAEHVKKQLSELDPDESGDHVLLSNIYAVAGKWKDVAKIRRVMRNHGINKSPGWSSIEVDKIVYTFVASDELSAVVEEARENLAVIILRLRMEGYIPQVANVLHDIEEEEKHDTITRHSEKLAVAFGLARIGGQGVIRIMKNLRICGDCHTVMKLISKVYERELVVRDRSRFHSFKEGSCSCRDYW